MPNSNKSNEVKRKYNYIEGEYHNYRDTNLIYIYI